jgi:hypothetical protein
VLPQTLPLNPLVKKAGGPLSVPRDIVAHVNDPTVVPKPLREALASADAAPVALLALGIPACPACEMLTASLSEIARSRPTLEVHNAALSTPQEWVDRAELLWPRSIHVSRASVPVLVLLRHGKVLAIRQGGGPAAVIDQWLTEVLGPADIPVAAGISADEGARLDEIADLRRRRLSTRYRSTLN